MILNSAAQTDPQHAMIPMACPYCGLLQNCPEISSRDVAICCRCRSRLVRKSRLSMDALAAVSAAGLLLLILGVVSPFLELSIEGRRLAASVVSAVISVFTTGGNLFGILVLFPLMAFPLVEMAGLVYVFWVLRFGTGLPHCRTIYRFVVHIREWSMIDIFLLGVLVAVVKLADLADVAPGAGLYLLGGAMGMLLILLWGHEPDDIWAYLEHQP